MSRGESGQGVRPKGASPRSSTVVRHRLVERLEARFEGTVTTVVGGAGSGKTTLLAHALRTIGDRVDVWYPCTRADRGSTRIASALVDLTADALDNHRPHEPNDAFVALREQILSAAPGHVCLVIDDAQHLGQTDVVQRLIEVVPNNGHVLLAGRSLPPFSDARLEVRGDVVRIDQADLMMTRDEVIEFANQRGLDASVLEHSDGWPAFVELASRGVSGTSRRYLEQEAFAELPAERRAQLAAFSFVGGGDDVIARAVTGTGLQTLLDGLPLVRWAGDIAILHDLWSEILNDSSDDESRRTAARHACSAYRDRGDIDRVIELSASVEDWDAIEDAMAHAIRNGVDEGIRSTAVQHWLDELPPERSDRPVAMLLRGVLERERDPTTDETAALFDAAAVGFHDEGIDELELVALLQLAYVARVAGDPARLLPVLLRTQELAERHPPARPFLAFGEGFMGIASGQPDRLLAAMEQIVDAEIPRVWQLARDSWIADAHRGLGYPERAVEVAPGADALSTTVPGALVSRSMALWFCGRVDEARRERSLGLEHWHGARDRSTAGVWIAMMAAWAGDTDAAREAANVARANAGESPGIPVQIQLIGVEMLIDLADGNVNSATSRCREVLDLAPIHQGGMQAIRIVLAVPYLLAPESRDAIDAADLGPSIRRTREVGRALVDARAGDASRLSAMRWGDPALLAVALPVRMAVELALHGVRNGRAEGRRFALWLCEHWGAPARAALLEWRNDATLGAACRDVLTHTPLPPDERVEVTVLGQTALRIDGYTSVDPDWRRERVRALLAWLIVRRHGTREQVAGALWPDLSGDKAARNLRTTLNYLHGVLEPSRPSGQAPWFVRIDGVELGLDESFDVDMWRFNEFLDDAEKEQRNGHATRALPLLLEAVQLYGGELAPDLEYEWLDLERIHLRSRFVRAGCRAAELLVALNRSNEAVDVARSALAADPWHEPSYTVLAAAYESLGDTTSARRVRERSAAQLTDL